MVKCTQKTVQEAARDLNVFGEADGVVCGSPAGFAAGMSAASTPAQAVSAKYGGILRFIQPNAPENSDRLDAGDCRCLRNNHAGGDGVSSSGGP